MSQHLDAIAESQLVAGSPPSWLDQLQTASWRGIPFQVDSIDWTAGDNVVLREYPFQDLPTVFRMGAGSEEIKLSAYVIGDDYHLQRDALMSALTGEGLLMHPTAGVLRCYVNGKFSVKESPTSDGGMARFDLTFIRADARRDQVGAVASTTAAATARADDAKAAAVDAFAADWSTKGQPGWVAQQMVDRVKASIDGAVAPIRAAAATINGFSAEVAASYRAIVDGIDGLIAAPRALAAAVVDLYRLPQDLSNAAARDFASAFQWAFDLGSQLPAKPFESIVMPAVGAGLVMYGTGSQLASRTDTQAQQQLAAMLDAGDALFELAATAAHVQAIAAMDLASYDEAMQLRAGLHAQLMRLMQDASTRSAAAVGTSSSVYDATLALLGAALTDLQTRSRNLVRLSTYTPATVQSIWTISHRLFGTTAYADEIQAMNPHIQHPLLVPAGRPLRVLLHA